MTDFRLLRRSGFYHAVTRYGPDLWTPFTYAGLHATERVLRRKEQHRFWGVDCYSHEEIRYLRIGNRLFYENPDQDVEPSAQCVVAADAWARELARNTLSGATPTLFCTPDGQCSQAVDLRPSRDLVSNPSGHPTVGRHTATPSSRNPQVCLCPLLMDAEISVGCPPPPVAGDCSVGSLLPSMAGDCSVICPLPPVAA